MSNRRKQCAICRVERARFAAGDVNRSDDPFVCQDRHAQHGAKPFAGTSRPLQLPNTVEVFHRDEFAALRGFTAHALSQWDDRFGDNELRRYAVRGMEHEFPFFDQAHLAGGEIQNTQNLVERAIQHLVEIKGLIDLFADGI